MFLGLGEYLGTEEHCEKAHTIATEIGNREDENRQHGKLGMLFTCLGEHQEAQEHHKKELAIAREIGDKKQEGRGYRILGGCNELKTFRTHGGQVLR